MQTAATETAERPRKTAGRGKGKPFVSGDPRVKAGPGRPPLSEAERERRLQAKRARERVVTDLTAELLRVSGRAIDTLVELLDDPEPTVRLRSATEIANRLWGTAISRSEVVAQINTSTEVHRVSPAELADAARLYLLRQGVAQAEEVTE